MLSTPADVSASGEIEELIRHGLVNTYFAPVAEASSFETVGYTVLPARADGNAGNDCDRIDEFAALRADVRTSGMIGDFDSSLRSIALRDAASAGLGTSTRLFLGAEPESLVTLEDRTDEPERSVILQLDPERIAGAPATVLRSVRQARQLGWGIGMKSIGPDLRTAAFLPLVNPSVVSLHPDVLHMEDRGELAELIRLLRAHVERTDAVVIAEGVATEADMRQVRAVGARYVTGPLIGAPTRAPSPVDKLYDDPLVDHFTRNRLVQGTPFSICQSLKHEPLIMDEALVGSELESLQRRALNGSSSIVIIGIYGEQEDVWEDTAERFASIQQVCGFSAMLSGGFDVAPVPGVRSGRIDHSDPLRNEYGLIVVGPDWSGMVTASRKNDPGREGRVEFDVYITTDRYACVDAARAVLTRVNSER